MANRIESEQLIRATRVFGALSGPTDDDRLKEYYRALSETFPDRDDVLIEVIQTDEFEPIPHYGARLATSNSGARPEELDLMGSDVEAAFVRNMKAERGNR